MQNILYIILALKLNTTSKVQHSVLMWDASFISIQPLGWFSRNQSPVRQ